MVNISELIHSSQRKSQTGQAQILAAILFLLLIPTTIIVAQNATENITGHLAANVSVEDATSGAPQINETNHTELGTPPLNYSDTIMKENETGPLPPNDTNVTPPENITVPLNDTNITLPDLNITINATPPENETNVTIPENQTQEPPEPAPILSITLNVPESANRNEPFILSADISNSGDADALGVEVEWILPDGFSILSGSGSHTCNAPAGGACTSEIEAVAPLSSMLGEQEIKVLVRYNG